MKSILIAWVVIRNLAVGASILLLAAACGFYGIADFPSVLDTPLASVTAGLVLSVLLHATAICGAFIGCVYGLSCVYCIKDWIYEIRQMS